MTNEAFKPSTVRPLAESWDSAAIESLVRDIAAKQATTYRMLRQHLDETAAHARRIDRELAVIKELLRDVLENCEKC